MLTIFASPKASRGHVGVIQRNAILSWARLGEGFAVVLLGDSDGTAELAREAGAAHLREVATGASGTPLVDDLFARAEHASADRLLAYVNADIVLMGDFAAAVRRVAALRRPLLMIGRRCDLDVTEPLDFRAGWDSALASRARTQGRGQIPDALDYFVFTRGVWGKIPPFALGRTVWDDWLVYRARERGAAVIDATSDVLAVHQNHDYGHLTGGYDAAWKGPEAQRNLELAGGAEHCFTLDDATHVLAEGSLRRALDRAHLRRRLQTASSLHPSIGPLGRALLRLADTTYHLRSRLGLALNPRRKPHG